MALYSYGLTMHRKHFLLAGMFDRAALTMQVEGAAAWPI